MSLEAYENITRLQINKPKPHLPTDAKERKAIPLFSGLVRYFPDALVAVAKLSQAGNDQHNPGQPLHWSREKSSDHEDTLVRHLFDAGTLDVDGQRHSTKVAWRALAILQLEIEKERNEAKQPNISGGLTRFQPQTRALNSAISPNIDYTVDEGFGRS
jgi:hypothetical protein